ncbi:23S ribosomal RNA methyltransferase [Serendipita vermifera]|nr:23S ribosomal RNA methyltransferase [Serendipita vermifera]
MSWRYNHISGKILRPPSVGQIICRASFSFGYSGARNKNLSPHLGQKRHKSSSTPAWLNRQRHDPFVKARGNYRSRSAFKLLQMNEQFHLFPKKATSRQESFIHRTTEKTPIRVVDLGALEDLYPRVVGVDLIPTEPLLGARFIQGDFMDLAVQDELHEILAFRPDEAGNARIGGKPENDAKVDMVISDMAPNLRGNKIADIEASLELCQMVLQFAIRHLKPAHGKDDKSGTLIMKHFAAPEFDQFKERTLSPFFSKKIRYVKPDASRRESSEAYFVCQGFKGPSP